MGTVMTTILIATDLVVTMLVPRLPLLRLLLLRLLPLPRLRRLLRPLLLRQLLPVLLLLQRSRQLNSNVVTVETVVAVVEDELSMKRHLLFSFNGQLMLIKRF